MTLYVEFFMPLLPIHNLQLGACDRRKAASLAMGHGEPRSAPEIGALLKEAGFRRWRLLRNHMTVLTSVIVATP